MDNHDSGQVVASAAEVYEEFFVPSLFGEWPSRVVETAELAAGNKVLDVACGTGILTRAAARAVSPGGSVTGLDINEGMLAVARRLCPDVTFFSGQAEELPFESASFDSVVCQFGLMFFADQVVAIREMLRVLRPGGKLAVAVWAPLEDSPGYAAAEALLDRLFGADIAASLRAPFSLGDVQSLRKLFARAGGSDVTVTTHVGKARFASVDAWMYTDIKGWTLADAIDDEDYGLLLREAPKALDSFVRGDGTIEFDSPAHIVSLVRANGA